MQGGIDVGSPLGVANIQIQVPVAADAGGVEVVEETDLAIHIGVLGVKGQLAQQLITDVAVQRVALAYHGKPHITAVSQGLQIGAIMIAALKEGQIGPVCTIGHFKFVLFQFPAVRIITGLAELHLVNFFAVFIDIILLTQCNHALIPFIVAETNKDALLLIGTFLCQIQAECNILITVLGENELDVVADGYFAIYGLIAIKVTPFFHRLRRLKQFLVAGDGVAVGALAHKDSAAECLAVQFKADFVVAGNNAFQLELAFRADRHRIGILIIGHSDLGTHRHTGILAAILFAVQRTVNRAERHLIDPVGGIRIHVKVPGADAITLAALEVIVVEAHFRGHILIFVRESFLAYIITIGKHIERCTFAGNRHL